MTTSIFKVTVETLASNFSTRPVGAAARGKLLDLLDSYMAIEIDLENRTLTPSFADECIGILAASLGLNEFKRRVKLLNVEESTRPLVKHVILKRCRDAELVH